MTPKEASEHYNIPISVLQEYESWGLYGAAKTVMGVRQYDDEDLERLSTIMTLHDIGFTGDEAEAYMHLLEQPDSDKKRLRMMEQKRNETLDEIHFHERRLARLDYLRHEIRKNKKE